MTPLMCGLKCSSDFQEQAKPKWICGIDMTLSNNNRESFYYIFCKQNGCLNKKLLRQSVFYKIKVKLIQPNESLTRPRQEKMYITFYFTPTV